MAEQRYLKPGRIEVRLLHNTVGWLTRHGVSIAGSRELAVRGRKSGEWRRNPVNPLTVGSERFLVAPRGQTQWVRNLRAAGSGQLRVGNRIEQFTAVEVPDADKPALLRAYLSRWKWEVGAFFNGVSHNSSDEELLRIAPDHPVFRITEHG
ncbi:nitroreductase family deazaflavin-dependent oxidoreductase [Streptomyces sp. NPDC020096]